MARGKAGDTTCLGNMSNVGTIIAAPAYQPAPLPPCGAAVLKADVPRIINALEDLDLMTEETMIAVDDGQPVLPRHKPRSLSTSDERR